MDCATLIPIWTSIGSKGPRKSLPYPSLFGVPQDSDLGPLLFPIFVNDLASHVQFCQILRLADDI